jgi:SAM-dependent methyltransferase
MKDTIDYTKKTLYSRPAYTKVNIFLIKMRNYLKYRTRVAKIVSHHGQYGNQDKEIGNTNQYCVLDIGCGSGEFLSLLSEFLPVSCLKGIELDSRLVAEAQNRCGEIEIINESAESLPFENESVNCITSFHNIEHLYCPSKFIEESYRILKKDGILLLATPNLAGLPAKLLKTKWHASTPPDHVSLKVPDDWNELFMLAGFEAVSQRTTFLSHIPVLRKTPVELINFIFLGLFSDLPWKHGDSYHAIFKKS